MAKKDPIELSVEEKLKTLYQLQTSLSEIDEKRALRGELPLEVQDLEDEIAGLTLRIDKISNCSNTETCGDGSSSKEHRTLSKAVR